MKRGRRKNCYYCGSRATSYEHVPPRMMFRGFTCDSITVPSCDEHNTVKSGEDQAVVNAMLMPYQSMLDTGWLKTSELTDDVLSALDAAKPSFVRVKRRAAAAPLLSNVPAILGKLPDMVYVQPTVDIRKWVRQLTAALVHDATGYALPASHWESAVVWSPDWFPSADGNPFDFAQALPALRAVRDARALIDHLHWERGWSSSPRPYPGTIYFFRMHIEARYALLRHTFYGGYNWFVGFQVGKAVAERLHDRMCRQPAPRV